MPEETGPLLKRAGTVTERKAGRFPIYTFRAGEAEVVLIRSGMGEKNATEATEALIASARPDIIISFGFGGAVLPGIETGDMIAGDVSLRFDAGAFSHPLPLSPSSAIDREWKTGTIITAGKIMEKRGLASLLPPGTANPVLDMETFAVARVAAKYGIPLHAVRCISDASDEELGFGMDEFCDRDLNLNLWRVMWTVARKPWIIPQLVRLARNSKLAGERLAESIMIVLARLTTPSPS